jgi:hypothetical protein
MWVFFLRIGCPTSDESTGSVKTLAISKKSRRQVPSAPYAGLEPSAEAVFDTGISGWWINHRDRSSSEVTITSTYNSIYGMYKCYKSHNNDL